MRSLIFALLFAVPALAEDMGPNVSMYQTNYSTLTVKGLGFSCLGMTAIPDGLPCNPAMAPLAKDKTFFGQISSSNDLSTLENNRQLLKGRVSQELVDAFFSDSRSNVINVDSDVSYVSRHFNIRYIPLTVKASSVIRNEANPQVQINAVEAKELQLQGGAELAPDFFAGVQFRFVDRRFVRQDFKLVELGTAAGRDILKPRSQYATYIEPGVTWFLKGDLKPRVSLLIANIAFSSDKFTEFQTPVNPQLSFAFSPKVDRGLLDINIEYRSATFRENGWQKFRLGSLYQVNSLAFTAGVQHNGGALGVFYRGGEISAGVVYSTIDLFDDRDLTSNPSIYLQFGLQI